MTFPVVYFTLLKTTTIPLGTFRRQDLKALAVFTLGRQHVKGPVELSLDMTGHKRIQELNRRFRGVDRTTDVISFRNELFPHPPFGHPLPLGRGHTAVGLLPSGRRWPNAKWPGRMRESQFSGDIAINVPQALLQAKKMRHTHRREIRLLLIHGILHLLGYTDYQPGPRRRMFKRQNAILRNWEKVRHS